jgi:hypothetical protein
MHNGHFVEDSELFETGKRPEFAGTHLTRPKAGRILGPAAQAT